MTADSRMDAWTDAFREAFCEDTRRTDWIVMNPPYSNPVDILKQAFLVSGMRMTFKLRLSFLEPLMNRVRWLTENPPHHILVLPCANYRRRMLFCRGLACVEQGTDAERKLSLIHI